MLRNFLFALFMTPCFLAGMDFTFPADNNAWEGDFADYPVNSEKFYELTWGWENLPTPIEKADGKFLEKGLFLSGNNHSDDLFMFARRKITDLQPNTWYSVDFSVLIESNVAEGSIGIGGSPGESVYFKAGVSTMQPHKEAHDGFYYLNVDKGDQAQDGENAHVIGDLANEAVDPNNPLFLPKNFCSKQSLMVQTDEDGSFWIFVGTDSGFEGTTKFYLAQVILYVEPVC